MNKMMHATFTRGWLAAVSATAAVWALSFNGLDAVGQTPASSKLKVVAVQADDDDEKKPGSKTIEIRIDDGKVTVRHNGKEVPDAHLRHEDGRIIILDAHGNPIDATDLQLNRGELNLDFQYDPESGPKGSWSGSVKLLDDSQPLKVMLGVHMADTPPALEYHFGLEPGKTTMIMGVFEGLPAHEAGIAQYDIITRINGNEPADNGSIKAALADKNAGDSVTLTIIHQGKSKDVTVKLKKFDAAAMEKAKLLGSAPEDNVWGGMTFPRWKEFAIKEMPKIKDMEHLFVAPNNVDVWGRVEALKPKIQQRLREHRQDGAGERKNLDDQLERLDQRMAELEQMLQKLIERQEKNR